MVKPLLDGEALRLCLPERVAGVGQDRKDAVAAGMESSTGTLCVLTSQVLGSSWCNLELRLATYRLVAKPGTSLLFLEPIDQQLPSYRHLAWSLQKEDYFDLSQERVEWDAFCEQLRKKLRKAGQEKGVEAVKERFGHAATTPRRGPDTITSLEGSL